jgi:hypothetical protein
VLVPFTYIDGIGVMFCVFIWLFVAVVVIVTNMYYVLRHCVTLVTVKNSTLFVLPLKLVLYIVLPSTKETLFAA